MWCNRCLTDASSSLSWLGAPLRSKNGVGLRIQDKVVEGNDIWGGEHEVQILHRLGQEETMTRGDENVPISNECQPLFYFIFPADKTRHPGDLLPSYLSMLLL